MIINSLIMQGDSSGGLKYYSSGREQILISWTLLLEVFYLLYKIGARKLLKVSPEVAKGDTFRCDWDVGLVCPDVLVNFNFGFVAKLAHEREKMGGGGYLQRLG